MTNRIPIASPVRTAAIVNRYFVHAKKNLGQNFLVAEKFTGQPGSVVPLADTIEAFDRICKGEFDSYPEQAFNSCGGLDDVEAAAAKLAGK